jgi:hypothetical protein
LSFCLLGCLACLREYTSLYLLRTARALLQSLSLRHGSSLASLSSPHFVRHDDGFTWLGSPDVRTFVRCLARHLALVPLGPVLRKVQYCKLLRLAKPASLFLRLNVVHSLKLTIDLQTPFRSIRVPFDCRSDEPWSPFLVVDRRGLVVVPVGFVPVPRLLPLHPDDVKRSFVLVLRTK